MSTADLVQSQKTSQLLRKSSRKKTVLSLLGGLGILLIVLLLLGWGLSAMQRTVSTSIERDSGSRSFSISTASQDYWGAQICFPSSCNIPATFGGGIFAHGLYWAGMPAPYSVLTGSLENFVDFSLTTNSTNGIRAWFSGPNGNLSSTIVQAPGITLLEGFPVVSPGNYSVHVWTQDPLNNATGQFSVVLRTVLYARPYATAGLETVIVALAAICLLGVVAAFLGYRSLKRRRIPHPPREETAGRRQERAWQVEPD